MYSTRRWLNPSGSSSTGSVVAWHGELHRRAEPEVETLFEVADCHGKVCLHKIKGDSMADFIAKLRILADTANDFADYLSEQASQGTN